MILNGRFGPYINYEKKNFKIPKSRNAAELTLEECMEIIEKEGSKKATGKKSTAKKTSGSTKKTKK